MVKNNKNSTEGYVNREIEAEVKYGYSCLTCHPLVQAYTKCHHCSLYSSSEMNLNIKVKVRVDPNVEEQTNDRQNTASLYHAKLKAGTTKSI